MSTKKKIAKRSAAAVLAIATIASGLSFGAAAASAADSTPPPVPVPERLIKSNVIFHQPFVEDDTYWAGPWSVGSVPGIGRMTTIKKFQGLEAALAGAEGREWLLPAPGTSGRITSPNGKVCVVIENQNAFRSVYTTGCDGSTTDYRYLWHFDNEGHLINNESGEYLSTTMSKDADFAYLQMTAEPGAPIVAPAIQEALKGQFTATVKSVDVDGRSAVVGGNARTGTTVFINDFQEVPVNEDGTWEATVSGLALGANTLKIEQFDGAEQDGELTLNVDLSVTPLTIASEFSSDLSKPVTVRGEAQKNGTVQLFHGSTLLQEVDVDDRGMWSTTLDAPNAPGAYTVTAKQKVGEDIVDGPATTIDYGAAPTITSPADGDEHAAGAVNIDGRGQASAALTIVDGDDDNIVATGKVQSNGTFRVNIPNLDGGEHELTVIQAGKGANTTRSSVTLNPGASTLPKPTGAVSFDADVTKQATIAGNGADGATIDVFDGATKVGTGTVAGGKYDIALTAVGAGNRTLTVKQTLGAESNEITVTANYGAAIAATSPAATTDSKVEISGTGSNGSKVSAKDATGTVRTTTVQNGTWKLEGFFAPGTTSVEITQASKGALTTKATVTVTVNQVRKDLVVTTPTAQDAADGKIKSGEVTFSGTATPFATVSMDLWAGGRTLFTVQANEKGEWTGKGWVGESTYTPIVKQTVLGSTDQITWNTFSTIAYQNLSEVRPTADDVIRPSQVLFSGKGSVGATVEVFTGPKDATWARKVVSTTVKEGGKWSVLGGLSANTTYTLYTYQTLGQKSDSVMNTVDTGAEIKGITGVTATNVGTSTTISGKAQPGATVEFWTGPKDQTWAAKRFTATADSYGNWSATGYLSTGNAYTLYGYQSYAGSYFGASVMVPFTPAAN